MKKFLLFMLLFVNLQIVVTKCGVEIGIQSAMAQDSGNEMKWFDCTEIDDDGKKIDIKSTVPCDNLRQYVCQYCGQVNITQTTHVMHEVNCVEGKISDMADLADQVYKGSGEKCGSIEGWENDSGNPLWKGVKFDHDACGFQSAIFVRKDKTGTEREYAYVIAGTNPLSYRDWRTNFQQRFGETCQYDHATENAHKIQRVAKLPVTFVGHSLGGGLASAAALYTGCSAVTFNAAGLSNPTKDHYGLNNNNASINAYIVKGDAVDALQGLVGLTAEGTHHNLPANVSTIPYEVVPSTSLPIVLEHNIAAGVINHSMDSVKDGLQGYW